MKFLARYLAVAIIILFLLNIVLQTRFFPPLNRLNETLITARNGFLEDLDKKIHNSKIPRIVHQIWISRYADGVHPLPLAISRFANDMKRVHEALGWEYHLWGDELYSLYKDDPYVGTYRQSNMGPETVALLADRLRLLLLRDYGGVFCDIDAKIATELGFEYIIRKLAPQTTFFAGLRRIEENDHMVEVAVLGSAPRSRVILGALSEYPPVHGVVNSFPGGGMVARWMAFYFDENSVLLNYHYFYGGDMVNETVVLQDMYQLGSWRSTISKSYIEIWTPETKAIAVNIMKITFQTLNDFEINGFAGGAALMGYARNGSIPPFDDTIDILVQKDQKDKQKDGQRFVDVWKSRLQAADLETHDFWGGWKVCSKSRPKIQRYAWSHPFVDVRWYNVKDGKTIEYDGKSIPIEAVEPIDRTVQMDGITVNMPRDVNATVSILFNEDYLTVCKSRNWDRQNEKSLHPLTVACEKLADKFPFTKGPFSEEKMKIKKSRQNFAGVWGAKVENVYFELMEVALQVCAQANIPAWLGGGSLLGLLRNGTLHPWDDSVDIMIEEQEHTKESSPAQAFKAKTEARFNELGYKLHEFWGGFKLYHSTSSSKSAYTYGYPNIDLRWFHNFNRDNEKWIKVSHGQEFRHAEIFPLKAHTLNAIYPKMKKEKTNGGVLSWFTKNEKSTKPYSLVVRVPQRLDLVARRWFGENFREVCKSRHWDRELEKELTSVSLACDEVAKIHPFNAVPPIH